MKILSERKQKMKTLVAVLLCSLAVNVSCSEKTSTEGEHDREKRWDLPNIDVSFLLLIFTSVMVIDPFSFMSLRWLRRTSHAITWHPTDPCLAMHPSFCRPCKDTLHSHTKFDTKYQFHDLFVRINQSFFNLD